MRGPSASHGRALLSRPRMNTSRPAPARKMATGALPRTPLLYGFGESVRGQLAVLGGTDGGDDRDSVRPRGDDGRGVGGRDAPDGHHRDGQQASQADKPLQPEGRGGVRLG